MGVKTIDVGVVGVGHLGQHHARLYAAAPGARLVGVVDRDPGRAAEIAGRFDTRVFDSAEELAREIQAASVAVPTEDHAASPVSSSQNTTVVSLLPVARS